MFARRTLGMALAIGLCLTAAGGQAAEHGGAKVDPKAPLFLKMDPLNVTVFDRGVAHGRITIEMRVDVLDKSKSAEVTKQLPRLYDGFLATVTQYSGSRAAADRAPDLDYLLAQFQTFADTTLGPNVVKMLVHSAMRTL